jgi:hypothetical protein
MPLDYVIEASELSADVEEYVIVAYYGTMELAKVLIPWDNVAVP